MKKILLICAIISIASKETSLGDVDQLEEGNLAVSTSQQPGPLFAFGQNVVDKGDFQTFLYTNSFLGTNKSFNTFFPDILYGITDSLSAYINIPVEKNRDGIYSSSGISDIFAQFEYAFYEKKTSTTTNQATVVATIFFPTGSATKVPPTGNGSATFFLGYTLSHLATTWYAFTSSGAYMPTKHNDTKFGNAFLYQAGFGRNLCSRSKQWTSTFILEFFGIYSQRDTINGSINQNSGGNIFFIGPSLWFSTNRFIIQTGIAFPITQKLFGQQNPINYLVELDIGWKFS